MIRSSSSNKVLIITTIVLATLVSSGGLFIPNLYQDTQWAIPQSRGQDLITLLAMPLFWIAYLRSRQGSFRATILTLGLLGYLLYTAIGAAFAYALNSFFFLYIAFFSCSLFSLISVASSLKINTVEHSSSAAFQDKSARVFLIFIAVMLSALWLGQMIPFLLGGSAPVGIVQTGGAIRYVYVLDLGLIVPSSILAFNWLKAKQTWGLILAGAIMIKATLVGLALLSMTLFSWLAGQPIEFGLTLIWFILFISGLWISDRFLKKIECAQTS